MKHVRHDLKSNDLWDKGRLIKETLIAISQTFSRDTTNPHLPFVPIPISTHPNRHTYPRIVTMFGGFFASFDLADLYSRAAGTLYDLHDHPPTPSPSVQTVSHYRIGCQRCPPLKEELRAGGQIVFLILATIKCKWGRCILYTKAKPCIGNLLHAMSMGKSKHWMYDKL
jgi:hypothetical protein